MKTLSDFLNRFRWLVKDDSHLRKEVSEVVEKTTGIVIGKDAVNFNSRGFAIIKCSPLVKSEIFMKERLIIETLNKKTNRKFLGILF
jgi:hypothetical protein